LPRLSPDGRWLAYMGNETGALEIYVVPFPTLGEKWQISSEGGTQPVWAPNGRELFYRNGNKMMAVRVTTHPTFSAEKPRLLFEWPYDADLWAWDANYDVAPDGQRFLMIKGSEDSTQLNVILNWFEDLKRRIPSGVGGNLLTSPLFRLHIEK